MSKVSVLEGNASMQPSSTKEKIQEQAIKLFKEYNYDQVTVMQICKAAGITKRTFYYHFSSKDEIVDELIGRIGKKVDQLVDVMLQRESNLAFLWAMLREYAVDAEENGPAITAQIYINILQKDVDNDFPQGMVLFRAACRQLRKHSLQMRSAICSLRRKLRMRFTMVCAAWHTRGPAAEAVFLL